MKKISSYTRSKSNVTNNLTFTTPGSKIIVKVPCRTKDLGGGIQEIVAIHTGLFINNNPYYIKPKFDENGQWELDTEGTVPIRSIKFDYNTKNNMNAGESIHITVFED